MPGPRIYVEGDVIPDWLDDKITAWVKEQMDDYRKSVQRSIAPSTNIETVVNRMFDQLSRLNSDETLDVVGLFIHEFKKRQTDYLDSRDNALKVAKEYYTMAVDQNDKLGMILNGNLQITLPTKNTFKSVGLTAPDSNLKKATDGEAIVSKRAAN